MDFSKEEVKRIAALARIEITEAEQEKFRKELSAILGFVEKLNEVNTERVLPMTGGTVLENITRADEPLDKSLEGESAKLIKALPEKKDGRARVKAVFD